MSIGRLVFLPPNEDEGQTDFSAVIRWSDCIDWRDPHPPNPRSHSLVGGGEVDG